MSARDAKKRHIFLFLLIHPIAGFHFFLRDASLIPGVNVAAVTSVMCPCPRPRVPFLPL